MVAEFLRLKVAMIVNLRAARPARQAVIATAVLVVLALTLALATTIARLRAETPDIARVDVTVLGSAVILCYLLIPLLTGADDRLDPRRFALFGLRTRTIATGTLLGSAIGLPTLVIAAIAVAQLVTWARGPGPFMLALVAAAIAIATCVLASRVGSGIAASFLASRRAEDSAGVILSVITALLAPAITWLAVSDWESQGLPVMRRIASALAWTPLGAVWGVPGEAAVGRYDLAMLRLAVAAGFVLALAAAWYALVWLMLRRGQRDVVPRSGLSLGWFRRLPATPTAAIAARSLSYWSRDSRYQIGLAVLPALPVVVVAALVVGGVPGSIIAWIPVPVLCLFVGWVMHNDVAMDSTAYWLHVSAHIRGRQDRWGRVIPALLVGIPLAILGSLATVALRQDASMLPGLIGLSIGLLFSAAGVSSLVSAAMPYAAVHPGDSPFAQPQAVGSSGAGAQALSLALPVLFVSPAALAIVFMPDSPLIALGGGVSIGIVILVIGTSIGAFIVDRRSPELLAFALRN